MKKTYFYIFIIITFVISFFLIHKKNINQTIYLKYNDNIINYIIYDEENIILQKNETYELKNKKIIDIKENKEIIKIIDNKIYTIDIGTVVIKVKQNDTIRNINIKIIPNKKIINIKNHLTPIFGPIDNDDLSMQNFDFDKNNIYLSFVKKSYVLTSFDKCLHDKKILNEINKVYVKKYKNNKYTGTLIINNSGHGQSFLVDNNYVWTTGDGYGYFDEYNRCWGKGKGLIKVKWEDKEINSKNSSLKIKLYNNQKNNLKNPEVSFDKENNLVSINISNNVLVYDLKQFKNKNIKNILYKFKLNKKIENIFKENKLYKQGSAFYGGYYYQLYGKTDGNVYIVIYDIYGNIVKTIKYNLKGLGFEAEGLKIYNNKLYIGITKNNKESYIYMIN